MSATRPLIGITADFADETLRLKPSLPAAVVRCGAVPVVLPCEATCAAEFVARCDGIILSGGDDPIMERWGATTHARATPIHPARQAFEVALLEAIDALPAYPVLGVCLGMQLMGLHAGGDLDQHLPDSLPTAAEHWGQREHLVEGTLGQGTVHSHHRQALTDPGRLSIIATAVDGVIEAVQDENRRFYVGVQWHPERTDDEALGTGLVRRLVECAGG